MAHPSAALERLAACIERGGGPGGDPGGRARQVIIRPIMAFIFQNHDLETLAFAMRHATRKAAARVYAMQVCEVKDVFLLLFPMFLIFCPFSCW